jgi:hypothetical protein
MSNSPRWRSPRRRSNEKSAKAIHREWVASGSPIAIDPATSTLVLMRSQSAYVPPDWLIKEARVVYHPGILIGPATKFWCTVLMNPWRLYGTGAWVTCVTGVRGWVACEALSRSDEPVVPAHNHKVGA